MDSYRDFSQRLRRARCQEDVDIIVTAAHKSQLAGRLSDNEFGKLLAKVRDRRKQLPERGEPHNFPAAERVEQRTAFCGSERDEG